MVTDLLNVKYKVHGRNKEEGFDCYGLAIEVLKRFGIELEDFYSQKKEIPFNYFQRILKEEKYCIILLEKNNINHIAIYLGNGKMIHSRSDFGVIIESLSRYRKYVKGFYKVSNS